MPGGSGRRFANAIGLSCSRSRRARGQPGFQQRRAMMLAILRSLVVQGFQVRLDRKARLAFKSRGRMRPCRRFVAELGMTGGDKRMMELIERSNAPERGNCIAVAMRDEISSAEVIP